jgi:dihydroorotate dehydrogenase (NAD+) catalytic subunit
MTDILSASVGSLNLRTPVIVASGVWPYDEEFWGGDKLDGIGALCTKAISFKPRTGNDGCRLWETPAGLLNSIGLQNNGINSFLEENSKLVSMCRVPVIANVVMEYEQDTQETLRSLSQISNIAAVELNISCPNVDGDGMAWGIEERSAAKAVASARKVWHGRLWVKMTPQAYNMPSVAKAIESEGADAIVAANTWLGMSIDMMTGKPAFNRRVAGLSGPAIFPLVLRIVWDICDAVKIPVIGCGGVSSADECAAMMLAGASAVEVGTAFFRDIHAGKKICSRLPELLGRYNISSVKEMIGRAKQ